MYILNSSIFYYKPGYPILLSKLSSVVFLTFYYIKFIIGKLKYIIYTQQCNDFYVPMTELHNYLSWYILFHLQQGLGNYDPHIKSSLLAIFINKVLLEHSHALLFKCLCLLSCHNSRNEQLQQRLYGLQRKILKCLLSSSLPQKEKYLLTAGLYTLIHFPQQKISSTFHLKFFQYVF